VSEGHSYTWAAGPGKGRTKGGRSPRLGAPCGAARALQGARALPAVAAAFAGRWPRDCSARLIARGLPA